MSTFDPAITGHSRVFLIEGQARPDHEPSFESCMRAGAPEQSFGDVTRIECPDPQSYGSFIEMGNIQGAIDRPTMDLVGRYAMDLKSALLEIAKKRCEVDVQVHLGKCTNPADFNTFTKALILEAARLTSWGADELGALGSDENNPVNETSPLSAREIYEVLQLSMTERAGDIVTNEVVDVVICDSVSCGDCDVESDGCQHIYAVTVAAGGSPGTASDIVHSIDKGKTWYADDIDTLGAAENASAVGCVGKYVAVVSNDSASLHYALKTEVDNVDFDEAWTEIATGFVTNGEPNNCWKSPAGLDLFIVGDLGYIYKCEDTTLGVSVLDAGAATTSNLYGVHSIGNGFAIAVGNDGAIVYATDGASFQAANFSPVGVGVTLNCVWAKSESEWFVGDSNGVLWWTNDKGENWTQLADFGVSVRDIQFSSDSVGYVASDTTAPLGQIRRTYDGGFSWQVLPEGIGTMAANDRVNALAACPDDVNFVVGVGLGDDGADGYSVVGED